MTEWSAEALPSSIGRRIDNIDGELERAICESVYRSTRQQRQRWLATFLLGLKHTLRGVLFSWPLYMMGLAALVLPDSNSAWLALFLLPGLVVSFLILRRGVAEDYRYFVHRVLLKPGALRQILWSRQAGRR